MGTLQKAKEPFRFYTQTHIPELTGLKASNLQELLDLIKTVPVTNIGVAEENCGYDDR